MEADGRALGHLLRAREYLLADVVGGRAAVEIHEAAIEGADAPLLEDFRVVALQHAHLAVEVEADQQLDPVRFEEVREAGLRIEGLVRALGREELGCGRIRVRHRGHRVGQQQHLARHEPRHVELAPALEVLRCVEGFVGDPLAIAGHHQSLQAARQAYAARRPRVGIPRDPGVSHEADVLAASLPPQLYHLRGALLPDQDGVRRNTQR
mmetsp:Transcript_41054/g.106162  ORF Transcript_41054/g.106162 Transcript_41054/m.106162 type:complete len:209 (-) Transcript_41054:461-1087(-)